MAKLIYNKRPTDEEARYHRDKKERQHAARKKILATKKIRKGLFMINTGTGKGKTTASMGLALRAIGHGKKVAIVQFVKGVWDSGERKALEQFQDLVHIRAMGDGFSWDTKDLQRDWDAARKAWSYAEELLAAETYDLIILDEINIVIRSGLLSPDDVVKAISARPPDVHVIATGRNADPLLVETADTVTEMTATKHHYRGGVAAQVPIEY